MKLKVNLGIRCYIILPSARKQEQPEVCFKWQFFTLLFVILSFLTLSRLTISQSISSDTTSTLFSGSSINKSPTIISPDFYIL